MFLQLYQFLSNRTVFDMSAADYSTAVSNLFQARGKRLQSKYEYILRTKIIEFYAGEE